MFDNKTNILKYIYDKNLNLFLLFFNKIHQQLNSVTTLTKKESHLKLRFLNSVFEIGSIYKST